MENEPTLTRWSSVQTVSEYEEMNPACRNTMEDAHITIDCFGGVEKQGLFAVFDGHGGRGVVDYLAKNYASVLQAELEYDENRTIEECLMSSYLIADIQTSKHGLTISGSTAVTCLIREEARQRVLYSANVGDSRAVLCRKGGKAERLTIDHKASDPIEMKRVEEAGGFILRKRVLGILSVTRSFGDHAMKKFVVARPYTQKTILEDCDKFLIIACDGVWDVLSDQEAVDLIRQGIEKNMDSNSLAQHLVSEAIERGSTDNVTGLVILL